MAPGLRTAAAAWLLWPRNKASLPPGGVPPVPDAFAHFGPGSWIVPPAEVVGPENIEIGADVVVLEHSVLHALPGARLQIGNRTILARGVRVMCTSTVVLQGSVSTSDYVVINDGVVVEEGAYVGCGAVLSPGVTIGRRAYVGEGRGGDPRRGCPHGRVRGSSRAYPSLRRRGRSLGREPPSMSALRQRLANAHRTRLLVRRALHDTTPPPPSAFASFGRGSRIEAPARVSRPGSIHVDADVAIDEHAWLSVAAAIPGVVPRLAVGRGTRIGRFAHIACVGEIDIGADVVIEDHVFIADTYHGYEDVLVAVRDQPMAPPQKVTIDRGAFIGARCIVLMGVTIGANALIDAGAVVTADVAPRQRVSGNPARPVSA